ncbi:DUF411 domain-containing protein [Methylibium sp.]|uniref:DUF411 domain-containing protein n=1 Tax=Methylibium sp. TaxID=2067992 RepID=UPI003BABF5B5
MAATSIDLQRRRWLALPLLLAVPAAWARPDGNAVLVDVWKSPSCGCCKDWVTHLESNGFKVRTYDDGNTAVRQRLGMPARLGSCHTASVGAYAIEGHVPAREIQRLLKDRPAAIGLAVPAMPIGSTGMDGPAYGQRKDPFDVLLVAKDGSTTTYQRY